MQGGGPPGGPHGGGPPGQGPRNGHFGGPPTNQGFYPGGPHPPRGGVWGAPGIMLGLMPSCFSLLLPFIC